MGQSFGKSQTKSVRRVDVLLFLTVVVFLYLLFFKLPDTPFYLEDDHLIFVDNAARMLGGEKMYADFFQFSFPGGQVLYLVLFAIFGTKYWILNFTIILIGSITFWIGLRISLKVIDGPLAYLPAILFAFFGLRWLGIDGSHRSLSPVFIWIALLLLLRSRTPIYLGAAAAFCGVSAFVTQQRGIAAVAAIVIFVAVDNFASAEKLRKTAKDITVIAVAFVATLAALCSYFIATAGFRNFIASTLEYPSQYYHYDHSNNPGVFFEHLAYTFGPDSVMLEFMPAIFYAFGVPLALVTFFGVFLRYRKFHEWEFWRSPMLVALFGILLVLATTAPSQVRYFPIAMPSLVLIFWLVNYSGVMKKYQQIVVPAVTFCLVAASAFIVFKVQMRSDYSELQTPRGTALYVANSAMERYTFLREHTKPGDFVFETPFPYVYFMLDLRNASRYSQFVASEYTRPEHVATAVSDLETTRPRYILWSSKNNKSDAERTDGDNLGPLTGYITEKYEIVDMTGRADKPAIDIWQRKDSK